MAKKVTECHSCKQKAERLVQATVRKFIEGGTTADFSLHWVCIPCFTKFAPKL